MSLGLSRQFGYHAAGVASFDAAPASDTPQTSLFSLLSNMQTEVNFDVSQKVDPAKPGAQALCANITKGLVAKQQEVNGKYEAAKDVIRSAQNEIRAAMKVCGPAADNAFPDTSSPDTILGLGFSAVANAKGGGSLATFMNKADKASTISDIVHDRQSRAPEEVKAEIRDVLCQSGSPADQMASSFGHIKGGDDTPQMAETGTEWAEVFEQYPDALEAIMYCDPDNPNPDIFPELADLKMASRQIEDKIAELEEVSREADRLGTPSYGSEDAMYMVQLDPAFARAYPQATAAGITLTGPLAAMLMKSEDTRPSQADLSRETELAELARRADLNTMPMPSAMRA